MSWTDWTSGDWLGKWKPQWPPSPATLPEAFAESLSRLVDVFGFSPAKFLHDTVAVASTRLIDHEVETTIGGEVVHFVLGELGLDPPQYGPLVGQFGAVKVELRAVRWRDHRVERLRIRAGNVHVQPGLPARLVAAPVLMSARVDQREVSALLARTTDRVVIRFAEGVATAALAGRESWGHVEIVPALEGQTVRLVPVAVVVRGRRLADRRLHSFAHLIPNTEIRLPTVLRSGRYTAVVVEGDSLRLDAVVDEWREPLQPGQLQDLDRRLRRPGSGDFVLLRAPPSSVSPQAGSSASSASSGSNR